MERLIPFFAVSCLLLITIISGCSQVDPSVSEPKVTESKAEKIKQTGSPYLGTKRLSTAKNQLNNRFLGTWKVEDLALEFEIKNQKGVIHFRGIDLTDKEPFAIQSINWNQTAFFSSMIMPSTGHKTHVKLSILDENRLRCRYSGDASGETIWLRQ